MASRLQDVILRGEEFEKPLATAVAPGTLYFSTDLSILERSNGSVWESYSGGGFAVPPHAATHNQGGVDPVSIIDIDGYVDDPNYFLRGDRQWFPLPLVASRFAPISLGMDAGSAVIAPGFKGVVVVPQDCIIRSVTLLSSVVGSIEMDIWKVDYANYPPTVANSITALAKPKIVSAIKSQDTVLNGWILNLLAGDILGFNVNSSALVRKVVINLRVELL